MATRKRADQVVSFAVARGRSSRDAEGAVRSARGLRFTLLARAMRVTPSRHGGGARRSSGRDHSVGLPRRGAEGGRGI